MHGTPGDGRTVFGFAFDPIRIVDRPGDDVEALATGTVTGIDGEALMRLCAEDGLRVGLRLYDTDSRSPVIGEFRALDVARGPRAQTFRAKFALPRSLFEPQQCRLAKLDLLYERLFWFEERLGSRPFLPIWVERSPREIDVFAYYQAKFLDG